MVGTLEESVSSAPWVPLGSVVETALAKLSVAARLGTRLLAGNVEVLGLGLGRTIATWLILPVVICLSQRLSHACLSTSLNTVKPRMAH